MLICRSPWGFGADRPPFRNRVEKKRETRGERLQKNREKEEASSRGAPAPDGDADDLFETLDMVPRPALELALVTMAGYSTRYHWIGIYILEGDELILEEFRGEPCPHDRIPLGEGMTGAVMEGGKSLIVPDVSKEPRYLECHPEIRSEIVVPIPTAEGIVGVVDIESHELNAFGEADRKFLENLAATLGQKIQAHRDEVLREAGELEFDDEEE